MYSGIGGKISTHYKRKQEALKTVHAAAGSSVASQGGLGFGLKALLQNLSRRTCFTHECQDPTHKGADSQHARWVR